MIVAALLLAIAALVVSVGAVLLSRVEVVVEPEFLAQQLRREVLVTLKSGTAFRGVLFQADDRMLVLRNAQAVDANGQTVAVDGEVVVLTGEVDFLQRP